MNRKIINLGHEESLWEQAADILSRTFLDRNMDSWPDRESALKEVRECCDPEYLCLGICEGDRLVGWGGLRPIYDRTWELHPFVIATEKQGRGLGRELLLRLEERACKQGIEGIFLGSDDERAETTLSQVELTGDNLFGELQQIRNLGNHPFVFYRKMGYVIVGAVPDANGPRKPDILMWKKILPRR